MTTELNKRIKRLIDGLVASGAELGLQVAAYVNGDLVVDAWAGLADEATGRPVDGETLFTSFSSTKGVVATCLHLLADRGLVDYDAPVATYWPEFAANGKAAITVRHALTHRAGVPHMPERVTPELMTDWEAMCAAIAAQAPLWPPGTKSCYHALTFGWIIGEIVHRVDGRPIAQFAQDELCHPLGIADFYLGVPDAAEGRVAPLREDLRPSGAAADPSDLSLRVLPPQAVSVAVLNRPDVRRASLPAGGGIMNARALARHYAMLAGYGRLDGTRLLSAERIEVIRALQTDALDELTGWPVRTALGYRLGGDPARGGNIAMGRAGGEFGHPGNGGALGFADPARSLGFGLTKNLIKGPAALTQSTAYLVAEALRLYLDVRG